MNNGVVNKTFQRVGRLQDTGTAIICSNCEKHVWAVSEGLNNHHCEVLMEQCIAES